MDKKRNLVLYHADCNDGFGAALVASMALGEADTSLVPVRYNRPPPFELLDSATDVYVLDFSYPDAILLEMLYVHNVNKLVVLDHHEPAFETMKIVHEMWRVNHEGICGTLHMRLYGQKSGAGLAWEYFFPTRPLPMLVRHVQDRDLWLFEYENTKKFMANLQSYPKHLNLWRDIFYQCESPSGYELFVAEGEGQLRQFNNYIEDLINKPLIVGNIDGFRVAAVACEAAFASELGNRLCEKYDAAIMYGYNPMTEKYMLSLRSRGVADVAHIARKHFNGNGHVKASGGSTNQHIFWKAENGSIFTGKRIEFFYPKPAK